MKKYLKAGIIDNGQRVKSDEGTAQGNIVSPVLANNYMHNALTLWFRYIIAGECKGKPWIMPKTSSKEFRQKIKEMKTWLYNNKEQKLGKLMYMLNIKLVDHYRYYGISFNSGIFPYLLLYNKNSFYAMPFYAVSVTFYVITFEFVRL